jgi:hypothetical protein
MLRGPHKLRDHTDGSPVAADHQLKPVVFPPSSLKATGRYRAYFVPWSLSRPEVTRLLPRGLEIASQDLVPADRHPVLFAFGSQERVCPIFQDMEGLAYREFLIAIPYLQWMGRRNFRYRGPFVYLPRLFLDHWLPVVLGWMCGFAKERACIESTPEEYRITSLFGRSPLIAGIFRPWGSAGRPQDFPGFKAMREIFSQPLVTGTPFGCMCLDFVWELERARLQAIDAEVRIEHAFLPGLPLASFEVEGIDKCAPGAFHLDVPWTLSRPFRPSAIGYRKARISRRRSSLPPPHFSGRGDSPELKGSAGLPQSDSPMISLG